MKEMSTKPRKRKDKEANTSYDEPKRHIVLSGKRDILGVDGKIDMSEDYKKFHEIPPFKVNADPSNLLNDELYLLSRGPSLTVLTYKGYEMGIHFTRSPKIKRAPTKTVVSALMQQPRAKSIHIMVT